MHKPNTEHQNSSTKRPFSSYEFEIQWGTHWRKIVPAALHYKFSPDKTIKYMRCLTWIAMNKTKEEKWRHGMKWETKQTYILWRKKAGACWISKMECCWIYKRYLTVLYFTCLLFVRLALVWVCVCFRSKDEKTGELFLLSFVWIDLMWHPGSGKSFTIPK